jgi:DNA-binding GntR family transcriptional regulator
MAKLTRIQKGKLSEQAYEILLHHIVAQNFEHGRKLQIDELAQQLGISRTPVKEALNLLAAEGLVELVPHIGTFVKGFSAQETAQILDIRRALEVLAAETLLDHLLPHDLARLGGMVANMEASFQKGTDLQTHSRRNYEFHLALIELSGNQRLVKAYESLHVSVRTTQISATQETWKRSFDEEAAEHRAILAALQTRDRTELMRVLALHLERSKERLIENMKMRDRAERNEEQPPRLAQPAPCRPVRQPRPPKEPPAGLSDSFPPEADWLPR